MKAALRTAVSVMSVAGITTLGLSGCTTSRPVLKCSAVPSQIRPLVGSQEVIAVRSVPNAKLVVIDKSHSASANRAVVTNGLGLARVSFAVVSKTAGQQSTVTATVTKAGGSGHCSTTFTPEGPTRPKPSPTPKPTGAVAVSVGYADGSTGLTPWQGSPGTAFIGEGPQCCQTHGPSNGSSGYDGGAIEVANASTASVTVNAVTVDFGGGSSPSHFSLWAGSGRLPMSIAAGKRLVLTMTNGFNFDTSDLFGEACHVNSQVVPTINVTINGTTTHYQDDQQILNSDGADLASCPGDSSEQHAFTQLRSGAQAPSKPVFDVAPALTGPATQGRIESALPGASHASPPPAETFQWLQCDGTGGGCSDIVGATGVTYLPSSGDVGHTLEVAVTANSAGDTVTAFSSPSPLVQAGPASFQIGNTSTGDTSELINTATELTSTVDVAQAGSLSDFTFFARGAGTAQSFTPRVYNLTNGNRGALVATGATVTVPAATDGGWYIAALPNIPLAAGQQYQLDLTSSGSYNGTYVGAEASGAISMFVDLNA